MQRSTQNPHTSSLAHLVCEWQPSALAQLSKVFSESSSKPQTSFAAYHSYKAYFEPLLLAEISADLSSALDKYQRAQLRQPKLRARREDVGTTIAITSVQKVTRVHTYGFGWAVDIQSHDRCGPVGCVDSDVVVLWRHDPSKKLHNLTRPPAGGRVIPPHAVLAVVIRPNARTGCRLVLTKFPDGNENGVRTDLEEGEENEEEPPALRLWSLLRIGSLTTMKREFQSLQTIKNSALLPKLLRPNLRTIESQQSDPTRDPSKSAEDPAAAHRKEFHSEYFFTEIIAGNTNLNPSQARAIVHASTCRDGFAVIQGPPGTGKTKTLISLLNVIHMVQYQQYYESVIAAMDPLYGSAKREREAAKILAARRETAPSSKQKGNSGSLLKSMMTAMNKTVSSSAAALSDGRGMPLTSRAKRPRILICAPSNSAVDEVLTRLTKNKLLDGKGNSYCPELARIGAGDRVSEAAKPFTAEGQAESFLDEVCGENLKGDARKNIQMTFLSKWQKKCNALLVQLERTPKRNTPESHAVVVDLHEKLERMERDLRRLGIAASDKKMSREEKLRQIARTYVEDAQLVFATLSGSASNILTKKAVTDPGDQGALFDTVIIDEAAQATETSSIIPMALGASRCILVGDPQQLPATVLSSGAAGLAYGQSLLERVVKAGQGILLLDTQYRMHPAISSFPRRYFYSGRLVDDESVQGDNRARPFHRDVIKPKLGPYVFLDISEGEERRSRDERSIFNPAEAELAALIYTKLKKEYAKEHLFSPAAKVHGSSTGFGVVTPYKRQMQELRQSFDRAGVPTGDVEIDTVDSYQGREKDVIVFSCVRTAAFNRGIGFVRDVRRMNVGLTRARASLIILGSAQALAEGSKDWAELIEDASSRGCLISVTSVTRCLMPPSPQRDSGEQAATEESQEASKAHLKSSVEASGNRLKPQLRQPEIRRVMPPHRIDPRTRMNRKLTSVPLAEHATQGHTDARRAQASVPPQNTIVDPSSGAATRENMQSEIGQVLDSDLNSGLHSTLQQMTKLFSDAGFMNTRAVEETLREHLRSGGELDVETVMAAAIATGQADSAPSSDANGIVSALSEPTETAPESDKPVPDEIQSLVQDKVDIVKPNTNNTEQGTGQNRDVGEKLTREQISETRSKPNPQKKTKKGKTKKEQAEKAPPAAEPSGWDMLFGASTTANGKPEELPARKQDPENESHIAMNKTESMLERDRPKSDDKQEGPSKSISEILETEDPRGRRAIERNSESPRQAAKRRWNDQNDREEKRRKGADYGGRGSFRSGRGADRGRHHNKRPRGSRQDIGDQVMGNAAGFGENWSQQVPFDPNLAGFAMMPNMMDQNMVSNPQAMLPMQMQQQILQQQALRQQAMQQQVFQQQAFQQQLQQQAMQQEALRQQALIMQMSAAGMPSTGMAPNSYPVADFDGLNGGGGMEAPPLNDSGNSWGNNNNNHSHGRRGRSGRGRGRQKGGRGRRY